MNRMDISNVFGSRNSKFWLNDKWCSLKAVNDIEQGEN